MGNLTKESLIKRYTELLESTPFDEIKAKYKKDISDEKYEQVFKLYRKLKEDIRKLNEDIERERLKTIFYEYLEALKNNRDTQELIVKYGLKTKESMHKQAIIRYLKNYATEEERENYKSMPNGNDPDIARANYILDINKRYSKLIKMLYAEEETKVFEYYHKNKISIRILKQHILENYQNEKEKNFLLSKVERYIEFHKNALMADRKIETEQQDNTKQEIIDKKIKLIEDIIKSGESICTYYRTHGIEYHTIQNSLSSIKKYDLKRYNRYIELLNRNKTSEDKNNAALALTMENMIENGIEEDNYIRMFDIVDYYLMVKKEPKEFIKSAQSYLESPMQILNLKNFLLNSYNEPDQMPFNEEKTLNSYNSILIDGTSRLITKEEKQGFIDYLKSNAIPVNNVTYRTMKKRFINLLTGKNIKRKTYM